MHTLTRLTRQHSFHLSLLLLLLPTLAHASLPKASNVPGGVAIVQLGNTLTHKQKPQAWVGEQEVLVKADKKEWYAVIGLPLDAQAGRYTLNVKMAGKTKALVFRIKKKKYPEQRITIEDKGKVELSPENEARAVREIALIKALKLHWSDAQESDLGFIIPAQGRFPATSACNATSTANPARPMPGWMSPSRQTPQFCPAHPAPYSPWRIISSTEKPSSSTTATAS